MHRRNKKNATKRARGNCGSLERSKDITFFSAVIPMLGIMAKTSKIPEPIIERKEVEIPLKIDFPAMNRTRNFGHFSQPPTHK
ncbi:MAG: hypothetical protein DRP85_08130 [Candidatus Makaraimicrobium thalassicum]|nr:MAG: hypothetical protein DRP85_08130 [Candidatus Omnitrophota bacterium]